MSVSNNPYSYEGADDPPRQANPKKTHTYWNPEEKVLLHEGKSIPTWMIFPHFPPEEIGDIVSVDNRQNHRFGWVLFWVTLVPALIIGGGIGFEGKSWLDGVFYGLIVLCLVFSLGAIFYVVLFGIALYKSLLKIRLRWKLSSFVGEQGFAVWYHDSILPKEETCDFFLFDKIQKLDWYGLRDANGKLAWTTMHAVFGSRADSKATSSLNYAIERAWYRYYFRQWLSGWNQNQRAELHLSDSDQLLFQQDQITLKRKGESLQLSGSDIVKLSFTYDGQLMLYLAESKLSENHGRLKYWLREMPNCIATMGLISKMLDTPLTGQQLPFSLEQTQGTQANHYVHSD